MLTQKETAIELMEDLLKRPNFLGKKPLKLSIAGEFDLYNRHYYIFKFKKSLLGKWLLGFCGGFEGDGVGHCGHIFSPLTPYDPATAQEECIKMIEQWKQADTESAEEKEEGSHVSFLGFVLLDSPRFDADWFRTTLKTEWDIDCPDNAVLISDDGGISIAHQVDGMLFSVGLMEVPVPDGEAQYWAQSNLSEPERAIEAARSHTAHLMVAILGEGGVPAGELFVKIASTCLKAPNALGIYTNKTVWMPEYFATATQELKEGKIPLMAMVFVGLAQGEKGICGYTIGLRNLGREEIEIIDSQKDAQEIYTLLWDIVYYLIEQGGVLHEGETIGSTVEQKLPITLSEGVFVEGMSLKIGF